ncbi:MAG: aquaporin family protein [Gammaproteobacteria bacterium]|nr:aquaporin family protein [Gammaproteobacteria bacterium]MDE1886531.1 aquaporin family protein [Gammaproteobacteria bacterium]MDE2022948.1 aquaporin family protein [Gammaproteobacteria bacterium]MDE2139265.1 aquaporin family protein [Gammaproteobacteria bacterium]MDE2274052.1 aquaporin family protein [Gammaproteobacteria bacterium]
MSLRQKLLAEGLGTALLLAVIVGSGIMAQRLANGNEALMLLANSTATGAGLLVLSAALSPVSGAHFNPLVSLMMCVRGDLAWTALPGYVIVQFVGAVLGVFATHVMFGRPILEIATKVRPGWPLAWSELIATFGLLLVIHHTSLKRPESLPAAVGGYIAAAYWFTSSTSFANPAVALARAFTDTFTGISPGNLPAYVAGECAGALLFLIYLRGLTWRAAS